MPANVSDLGNNQFQQLVAGLFLTLVCKWNVTFCWRVHIHLIKQSQSIPIFPSPYLQAQNYFSSFTLQYKGTRYTFYKSVVILSCVLPWHPIMCPHPHPARKKYRRHNQQPGQSECTVPVPRIPCDKLQKEAQNKQKNIDPVSINWLNNATELKMETQICKILAVTLSKSIPYGVHVTPISGDVGFMRNAITY